MNVTRIHYTHAKLSKNKLLLMKREKSQSQEISRGAIWTLRSWGRWRCEKSCRPRDHGTEKNRVKFPMSLQFLPAVISGKKDHWPNG